MSRLAAALTVLALVHTPSRLLAQERTTAFVFGAPALGGNALTIWHLGGGGEQRIAPHVTVAEEIGTFVYPGGIGGAAILSMNAVYRTGRWQSTPAAEPFFTGGYTAVTGGAGVFSLLNVGGGVDSRVSPNAAFRFELRDYMSGRASSPEIRVGLVFRTGS